MPETTIIPAADQRASLPVATATIASIGTAVPAKVVRNDEIAARIGVDPVWVQQRTGIRERHVAARGDSLTMLAIEASERALEAAALPAGQLDLVLVASFTQDQLLPNAAPLVAEGLGAGAVFACDLGAACTGFLSGLALASGQIESGRARHALVVGADLLSRVTDHDDRKTAGLFADGAGAAVLSATAAGAGAVEGIIHRSDGSQASCIEADHDERLIRMRGQDTFRAAVDSLSEVTLEVLTSHDAALDDIDLFVYHQANARITHAVGERLGLPPTRVVDCIERLGNTSAATLPLALEHAAHNGQLYPGARVLVAAFGAGFVWGGGLLTWEGKVAA